MKHSRHFFASLSSRECACDFRFSSALVYERMELINTWPRRYTCLRHGVDVIAFEFEKFLNFLQDKNRSLFCYLKLLLWNHIRCSFHYLFLLLLLLLLLLSRLQRSQRRAFTVLKRSPLMALTFTRPLHPTRGRTPVVEFCKRQSASKRFNLTPLISRWTSRRMQIGS